MPPRSLNRPQHERMYRIFKMIQDGGHPNCEDFVRETEADRRTILRDLDYLRDRMRLPIAFDRKRNGYQFTRPVTDFPLIEMSDGDLLMLFIAERACVASAGSGLEARLQATFERLASLLGSSLETTWKELDDLLSVRSAGATTEYIKIFEDVQAGVRESRELQFSYLALEAKRPSARTVQPYHLGYIKGQWYLFAFDPRRNDIRTFALSRMKSVRLLKNVFSRELAQRVTELLDESFGVIYEGDKPQVVRAVFFPPVSRLVTERTWHSSQSFKRLKDGRVEMTMKVRHLKEVANWLSSWGPGVKVLEPAALRNMISQRAKDTQLLYEE